MRVAVVTPHHDTRRAVFLDRLRYYMERQTMQPDMWIIVDDEFSTGVTDLTKRVRIGCERAKQQGADVVLIMEDDDWYHSDYIKTMVGWWVSHGRPQIFGIGYTLYFHLAGRVWHSDHKGRASLMSTLVSVDALERFTWPADEYVWLDIELWKQLKGRTVEPQRFYSVGIKHGIGLCGGVGHNKGFSKYKPDPAWSNLKRHLPASDIEFYKSLYQPA